MELKTQNEFSWWNSIQWQIHYLPAYSQLQSTTHIEINPILFNSKPDKFPSKKKANENINYITEICWLCGFIDKVFWVLLRQELFLSASIYQLVILWNTALQSKFQGCVRWAVREAHLTQIAVATLFFADWSMLVCMVVLYVRSYLKKKRKRRFWVQIMSKLRLSQGHF